MNKPIFIGAATRVQGAPIPFVEFVALIAALMSLTALGIDSMLPGLPAIGRSLHVADENSRQFVITSFVLGFGVAQLAHGPLADRFGRRRLLLFALTAYAIANVAAAGSPDFLILLAARFIGGASVSACRVAVVALVRDCFQGRSMARVMSIAFMVFMIVPVLAPSFGTAVLLIGSWRLIFWTIAGITIAILIWFAARMPETLHEEDRQQISFTRIWAGWRTTLSDRASLGYTLGSTALLGSLYGYLNSVQQVMQHVFRKTGTAGGDLCGHGVDDGGGQFVQRAAGHSSGSAPDQSRRADRHDRDGCAATGAGADRLGDADIFRGHSGPCSLAASAFRRPISRRWRWRIWGALRAPPPASRGLSASPAGR